MKILVSQCLLGIECRFDGKSCKNQKVIDYVKGHTIIAVCPEMNGGLPCPRIPGERVGDKITGKDGSDLTPEYTAGALHALQMAKENNVDLCILKSRSPSCGKGMIHDGTFTGTMVEGNGVTCELLTKNGFKVIADTELE